MTLKTAKVALPSLARHTSHGQVTSQAIKKIVWHSSWEDYQFYTGEYTSYFQRAVIGVDWSYRSPMLAVNPSNTFDHTNHGYVDGDAIKIKPPTAFGIYPTTPGEVYTAITRTKPTAFDPDTEYYVVNATSGDFQVAATVGGAPMTFGGDGTAYMCIYDSDAGSPWVETSAHYPLSVSYRVVSSDNSFTSNYSTSSTFYTTPSYGVWYRFCKSDEPDQTDSDNSSMPWTFLHNTETTYLQPRVFAEGPTTHKYIQFAICGTDSSFTMQDASEGGADNLTGDGSDANGWNIHREDLQVLFVTTPNEHVVFS